MINIENSEADIYWIYEAIMRKGQASMFDSNEKSNKPGARNTQPI